MTAADIYLSAMHNWKPKQEQQRSPEKERKQEQRGQVIDFMKARERLRSA